MTIWRTRLRDPLERLHDVFIDGETTTSTEALERELEQLGFHAKPIGFDGVPIRTAGSIGALGLSHGSTLTCGALAVEPAAPGVGRHLVVVCGPDAGRHVVLPAGGGVTVGRSARADLHLDDSLLSGLHCRIDHVRVDGVDTVTVSDLGSTNGTSVEGVEITEPTELHGRTYLQVGSSVLAVVDVTRADVAVVGELDGAERVFPRQYRVAQTAMPQKVDAPSDRGSSSSSSGGMWWRALLPLVTGFGFAAITGRWIFLLIMIIGPIVMAVEAFRRKRRRDREVASAAETYTADLAAFRENVVALRREERDRRRSAAHCGGLSLLVASTWHRRMWERASSDDDFLSVPVGLAAIPSAIAAEDPDDALPEEQWGTPVESNLLRTGSLGIVGPPDRARAVARGVVMNLVTTHSPAEVRLWILATDDTGDEWGFARWLPHVFEGADACRIAVTETDRAQLTKSIKQLLDTRAEVATERGADRDGVQLPVHVVVVDGTDLLQPGELAELLGNGPRYGIVGLTIDPRLAPEGLGATLTLTDAADLGRFDSRHQHRLDSVILPEVAPAVAERAARRMASLRPATDDDGTQMGEVCHLVDIDGLGDITGDRLVERWRTESPNSVATVGMSGDVPMRVDLVADGPHGLVGGTSGSGKTEFLKTLFLSLCVNNHPDDLSIVIVDFKGGVDHDAVRALPHVIDVATNLDLDQFERTVSLLRAEQMRRQELLGRAGASNVVSYRVARASRPDLPPLPRLVVVVDEFGELLASEGGRERLKELESITRIGRALGLHLLLVTQNFENSLPPQIDANAGLRICLRVQKPSHSKAVLDSGVAATIHDRSIGRAYARFHGRDLVEFQTARVAGRRRDLTTSTDAEVRARHVMFAMLANPPRVGRTEDVPFTDTDMFVLVERIREAAATSGWVRSAVPWPSALPAGVSLEGLVDRYDGTGVPIGLLDLPAEQRRATDTITDRDEQLLVLGGPSAPVPEVLTTYAATLALLSPADDVHLYGIDLVGRSLAQLAELPHCGGVAVRNEQLALRIVRWLVQVAAERRIEIARTGSANVWEHATVTGELPPQLVLLVSGADRLLTTAEATTNHLLGPLTRLMGEAIGVRIQIVLAGLPKIAGHRLGMNVERRLVLQTADINDLAIVGVHRSFAAELRTERRAVDLPAGRVVQLAQLAQAGQPEGPVIRSLAASLARPTRRPPQRFVDVTWPLLWEHAAAAPPTPPAHFVAPLPVAIDTESGEWVWIDGVDDGPVFAVAGQPKSGRSSTLAALARLAHEQGWAVLNVLSSRRSPLAASDDPALAVRVTPEQLSDAVAATSGQVLVVIDDLQRLEDAEGVESALKHRERVLCAVSGPVDFLSSRTGVMRSLPAITAGILLAPTGSLDGSAIGLRRLPAEWTSNPRPGRGILGIAGDPTEVQVPLVTQSDA